MSTTNFKMFDFVKRIYPPNYNNVLKNIYKNGYNLINIINLIIYANF